MPEAERNPRYKTDKLHARSLEGNPIGSPVERALHVYLPPGYYEDEATRYPAIYCLHGYDGSARKVFVYTYTDDKEKLNAAYTSKIVDRIDTDRLPSYPKLDKLISEGKLKPFIFVQPDGSLHIPSINGLMDISSGGPATKGSYYTNSPFTGNFGDYIIWDVIGYVDRHYRTIADKNHRALMGGSMGGYGTLRLALQNPDVFIAAAAMSTSNRTLRSLSYKMVIPLVEQLLGREAAEKNGAMIAGDIADTIDLIYSHDRPLLPSIKRGPEGSITGCDALALENWERNDLNNLILQAPQPFKDVHLFINCHQDDDFGFVPEVERLHSTLIQQNIGHEFNIYSDPKAAPSPHIFGISYSVISAITFCQQYFT